MSQTKISGKQTDLVTVIPQGTAASDITEAMAEIRSIVNLGYPAKLVFLPYPTVYTLSASVNMTDIRPDAGRFWFVEADGAIFDATCTGKAAFDLLHSRRCNWRGGTILGDAANVPRVGVQLGRRDDKAVADNHRFYGLTVAGNFSLAPMYNYASEGSGAYDLQLRNDAVNAGSYCLALDGEHVLGAQSDYQAVATLNNPASFNEVKFYGLDARKQVSGTPIWMNGMRRGKFDRSYAVSNNAPAAIIHTQVLNTAMADLDWDVHCETINETPGITHNILFTGTGASAPLIRGFRFREFEHQASTALFGADGTVASVALHGADIYVGGVHASNTIANGKGGIFASPAAKFSISGNVQILDDDSPDVGLLNLGTLAQFHGTFICRDRTKKSQPVGPFQLVDMTSARMIEETGTFTPLITFATPGNLSNSYAAQTGFYYRMGPLVFVHVFLTFTPTHTTSSGNFRIDLNDLPYTAKNFAGSGEVGLKITNLGGAGAWTWPAGTTFIEARKLETNKLIEIYGNGTGIASAVFTTAHVPSGTAKSIRIDGAFPIA